MTWGRTSSVLVEPKDKTKDRDDKMFTKIKSLSNPSKGFQIQKNVKEIETKVQRHLLEKALREKLD